MFPSIGDSFLKGSQSNSSFLPRAITRLRFRAGRIISNAMQPAPKPRRPLLDLGAAPVLVVGVTGHRDLRKEDISILSDCIRAKLKALRSEFPDARLVLMSALAEGADQLVAKVAMGEMGFELLVPLPFSA